MTNLNQNEILETMKGYIDSIGNYRNIYGVEHPSHDNIFDKINKLYDKLTFKNQNEFDYYCN